MHTKEGFVKLPRSILDWRWYTEPNVLRLYIHLLLNASFKDTEWKTKIVKKGQVITGRKALAAELEMSESQVRTALEKLEKSKDISISATNKYSIITLLKWAEFEEKQYFFTNKSPTNHQQANNKSPHKNKYNKVNNVNNYSARAREKKSLKNGSIDWSLVDEIVNG